jgi:hypothetical protein
VALNLLDNVFLLHLALEAAQSVLEAFALLKSYFCQTDTPPNPSGWTEQLLQGIDPKSRGGGGIYGSVIRNGKLGHFETVGSAGLGKQQVSPLRLHFLREAQTGVEMTEYF